MHTLDSAREIDNEAVYQALCSRLAYENLLLTSCYARLSDVYYGNDCFISELPCVLGRPLNVSLSFENLLGNKNGTLNHGSFRAHERMETRNLFGKPAGPGVINANK